MRVRKPRASETAAILFLVATTAATIIHARSRPALAAIADRPSRRDPRQELRLALDELSRHPSNVETTRLAARSYSELLYPDDAERHYRKLAARGRLTAEDRRARLMGLLRSNRPKDAIGAARGILSVDPDDAVALRLLATLLWTNGDTDEALIHAQHLARLSGHEVEGYSLTGTIRHEREQWAMAADCYVHVLELDPDLKSLGMPRITFWRELGMDLVGAGRGEQGIRLLFPEVQRTDDPMLTVLLGECYSIEGRTSDAESCWKRAVDAHERFAIPLRHLARVAIKRGEAAQAVELLERATTLEPASYDGWYGLSAAYRLAGRPEDARRATAKAEQIRPGRRKEFADSPVEKGAPKP